MSGSRGGVCLGAGLAATCVGEQPRRLVRQTAAPSASANSPAVWFGEHPRRLFGEQPSGSRSGTGEMSDAAGELTDEELDIFVDSVPVLKVLGAGARTDLHSLLHAARFRKGDVVMAGRGHGRHKLHVLRAQREPGRDHRGSE